MTTLRSDPEISLPRVLLLPVALVVGIFAGMAIGAIYLPYLVLSEIVRKIGQHWGFLTGWMEWAESGGRKGHSRPGWMLVWVVWVIAYLGSACSWGWIVGMVAGPFVAAWLCLVSDGWDRLLVTGQQALDHFRRLRITVHDPRDGDFAPRG